MNTITEKVDGMERILSIKPAWDKRSADPAKNYGIHGMEFRFVLRGERGAVQFLFYSGTYLRHIERERLGKVETIGCRWMGVDVGYHSPVPQYTGQTSTPCDLLPGHECYYDGSSLAAESVAEEYVSKGPDAVWTHLLGVYLDRFPAVAA